MGWNKLILFGQLTMDTLALGYTLPAIGRVTDLHRLENVRAGRTENRQLRFRTTA